MFRLKVGLILPFFGVTVDLEQTIMCSHAADDQVTRIAYGARLSRLVGVILLAVLVLAFVKPVELRAQEVEIKTGSASAASATPIADSTHSASTGESVDAGERDFLIAQIESLSSPSYRAREMAVWRLEQQPAIAIELISERLPNSDLNTGSQLIELLSKFAMRPEMSIGVAAIKSLESAAAEKISVLAHLAQNSLQAIADAQETQAFEILTNLGAEISYPKVMINGMRQNTSAYAPVRVVMLDSRFTGSAEDTLRLRFLQQVDAVYVHDIRVHESLVRAICQMPNLRMVILSHVELTAENLKLFQGIKKLDHFELSYVPIDDEQLPILEGLPVWGSMRLFGTKISKEGGERLRKRLDGLSLYLGRGGFLGIGTMNPANLVLSEVQPGSAAAIAKLRSGDKLTHINSVPIKTFEELRAQLANYAAGEEIQIQYQRDGAIQAAAVVLGEAPIPANER